MDDRGIEGPTPEQSLESIYLWPSGVEGRRWRSCVLRSSNSWSMSISSMLVQPAQIAKLAPNRLKTGRQTQCCPQIGAQLPLFRIGLISSYLVCSLVSMILSISQPSLSIWWPSFSLMTISQGFMSFYNVFYESKDLQFYRPYAFSDAEVIAGKSISVILTLLMAILH